MTKKTFQSTKTYTHAEGLSACFRQWRATHSHCQYLHGYALQVKLVFNASELDHRNWVQDFGGLKDIKQWLKDTFDHKTLVAKDDPKISIFREMNIANLIDLIEVDAVGCEKFAEMIFDKVNDWLTEYGDRQGEDDETRVKLKYVEVSEHAGNSAICRAA